MTTPTITVATWRDVEGILMLRNKLDEDTQAQTGITTEVTADRVMGRFYETLGWFYTPNQVIYVAKDEDKCIGYVAVSASTFVGNTSGSSIFGYYVLDSYRNTTVATRLLKHAMDAIITSTLPRAQAVVMSENGMMLRHMVRMGFKPVAIVFDREVGDGKLFRARPSS